MNELTLELPTEAYTEKLGAALARAAPPAAVIALDGELGAGKTRLVQAFAAELGVSRHDVVSPTFVLVKEYPLPNSDLDRIYHIDAYRLDDPDQFLELGPDEIFATARATLVEWAQRVAECLPPDRIEVHLFATGPTSRRATITAPGTTYAEVLSDLRHDLPDPPF